MLRNKSGGKLKTWIVGFACGVLATIGLIGVAPYGRKWIADQLAGAGMASLPSSFEELQIRQMRETNVRLIVRSASGAMVATLAPGENEWRYIPAGIGSEKTVADADVRLKKLPDGSYEAEEVKKEAQKSVKSKSIHRVN